MTEISVIIPFKNNEKNISKCLSSLMYQSFEDIEIICIDNNSADNTKETVQHFAQNDSRIAVFDNESCKGRAYLLNKAIERASGKYISFIEPEGWCALDMYGKLYKTAEKSNSDIVMYCFELYEEALQKSYINDESSLKAFSCRGSESFKAAEEIESILKSPVFIWNKIYKKDFLLKNNIKFLEGYPFYEEIPFLAETYIKAERINILWENVYFHRIDETAAPDDLNKKNFSRIYMLSKAYNIFKQADFFQEKKSEIINMIIDDVFGCFLQLKGEYLENYYNKMREFFIFLNNENPDAACKYLSKSGFECILKSSFAEFLEYIIENNISIEKRIKEIEAKYAAAAEEAQNYIYYLEHYMQDKEEAALEAESRRKELENKKIKKEVKRAVKRGREKLKSKLELQYNFLRAEKEYELKILYDEMQAKLDKQTEELKEWEKEALRQQKEHLASEFEFKLRQEKQRRDDALSAQKNYYENHYLLVKILFKIYKKAGQLKNKVCTLLKRN